MIFRDFVELRSRPVGDQGRRGEGGGAIRQGGIKLSLTIIFRGGRKTAAIVIGPLDPRLNRPDAIYRPLNPTPDVVNHAPPPYTPAAATRSSFR